MSPEQWQQVKSILAEALDRPPAERAAFAAKACAGDAALHSEVVELLGDEEDAGAFLEEPAACFAAQGLLLELEREAPDPPSLEAGRQIGPYRIVHLLGSGGMGAVYLAERADGQFRKQAALKIIKRGMDTDEIIRRFHYERQILAQLEHPGIARLLDGHVTEDGLPYFVMEYVEGNPIDTYCDRKQLSIRARLQLFQSVCEAVQYAHQSLVVHRDLKPSNVLVAERGANGKPSVKLLDFGIAKLLNPEQPVTTPLTQAGTRRLTPEYAAPEQVRGEPVTTAADVYALGVILYELLTGRPPYRFKHHALTEIERTICETVPEKPSAALHRAADGREAGGAVEAVSRRRATRPEALRRALTGDLDAIALTALKKEPARRYASAAELSSDIGRHLEGRPVSARDDSFRYRTAKFVQRNKTIVATAAFAVLALMAGAAATAWQARVASEEATRANETLAFFMEMFETVDPAQIQGQGGLISAEDLIDPSTDRLADLDGQPLVQAAVMEGLGELSLSLGALAQADSLYRMALSNRRRRQEPDHPDVARSMYGLASALVERRQFEEAEQLYREALAVRRAGGSDRPDLIRTLNGLAFALYTQSTAGDTAKGAEAEQLYREALTLTSADSTVSRAHHAEVLDNLATLLLDQGRLNESESLYREALALRREVLGADHSLTAETLYGLGRCLKGKGKLQAAKATFDEALQIYRTVYGEKHYLVAEVQYERARLAYQQGQYQQAERFYREAASIFQTTLPNTTRHGYALVGLGKSLIQQGKAVEAEAPLRRGLALCQKAQPRGPSIEATILTAEIWIGRCLTLQGRYAEAESLLVEGYQRLSEQPGQQARKQEALDFMVQLYEAWSKPSKAE